MEEKKWGTSGRMEHIGDVFPVLEEKKKRHYSYTSWYWFLIDTVTLKWLVNCEMEFIL